MNYIAWIVVVIIAGLIAYAIWQFIETAKNTSIDDGSLWGGEGGGGSQGQPPKDPSKPEQEEVQ